MNGRTAVFLLLTATLLAIALSTGTAVYYLMAAMMGMMALVGFASALTTLLTLKIGIAAQKRRVVRGETVAVRLTLRRRTMLPTGLIELEVSAPDDGRDMGRMVVDTVPLKGREYRYAVRCAHRGLCEVGISRLRVTDVFGLFSFSRRVKDTLARVEVTPRVSTVPAVVVQAGDENLRGRVRMTEDLASPSGVRDWEDGDSLKKVHWKLTARRRALMVRTFEESARPDFLILMDCAPVNALQSHVRTIEDVMCESAASAALAQMQAGYTVRMPLNTSNPSEISGQTAGEITYFLSALTWLAFDSPYSFEQVIALELRRMQRTGALILISTRLNASLAELALRVRQIGVEVQYVWVAESVNKDSEAMKNRLELMGVPVRRVNPWSDEPEKADARPLAEQTFDLNNANVEVD